MTDKEISVEVDAAKLSDLQRETQKEREPGLAWSFSRLGGRRLHGTVSYAIPRLLADLPDYYGSKGVRSLQYRPSYVCGTVQLPLPKENPGHAEKDLSFFFLSLFLYFLYFLSTFYSFLFHPFSLCACFAYILSGKTAVSVYTEIITAFYFLHLPVRSKS